MIKGMTLVTPGGFGGRARPARQPAGALGFEPGKRWQDETGRGEAFLAPLGNLELVAGRLPAVPPILIEVTQLDQVRAAVEQWMVAAYRTEEVAELLSEVAPTHWNSRLFTVTLDPSLMIGFWESENPLHGKPIAVEGDLSAAGMRFAIVVARWNAVITDRLLQGALDGLLRSGAAKADIQVVRVPGRLGDSRAARTLAES
jgi:6,7-dimethyl-8-ribityllumazine synthase